MGGGNHGAVLVEQQVINWIKEALHFPADASGLLVSGGSMANLVALTVARNVKAGYDVRAEGVAASQQQMVVYASTEVHSCNQKAVELMGLGSQGLHKIPVLADYRIDLAALEAAIVEGPRSRARNPFASLPMQVLSTRGQ